MYRIAGDFNRTAGGERGAKHLAVACRSRAARDLGGGSKAQELVEIRRAGCNGLPQQQRGRREVRVGGHAGGE